MIPKSSRCSPIAPGIPQDFQVFPKSAIFTAEARAILLALECIEHSNRKRFLIFTDSMSCLQALDHLKFDHPIIEEIISKLMSLKASGFDIHLCWLPGHVGILGNEHADRAAKAARRTDMQPCLIPPSDFKPIIPNTSPPCGRPRGTSHH